MSSAWNFVVAVAQFLYGFLVGDDLAGAVAIVVALVVTSVLVANHVNAWWLVPPVAIAVTAVNLYRRRPKPARRAS
jgi:hypothetical protein